jgi:hypothetical protein
MATTLSEILRMIQAFPLRPNDTGIRRFTSSNTPKTQAGQTIYSLSLWGSECWLHAGQRTPGNIGYLVGSKNLGADFKIRLTLTDDEFEALT